MSICLCDFKYKIVRKNPEKKLVERLKTLNLKVALAESFTGGLVSKKITDIPGASKVFEYGFCTYSNGAKMNVLKVEKDLLEKYTAVSKEVALSMVLGAKKIAKADVALSLTGYAGSKEELKHNNKVGVVYVGASFENNYIVKLDFGKKKNISREYIREQSAIHALSIALELLK